MAFLPALAVGSAATATTAATTGLFGAGGAFSLGSTLGTIGTGLSVVGGLQMAKAASATGNYNATAARQDAASKEAAQRAAHQRQLGAIRASIGKSGATTAGTPLMVLAESAANAEIDALNTRRTGVIESDLYTYQGKNASRAGRIGAGTSLLSGMSKIF